jgi:hypothetical protein
MVHSVPKMALGGRPDIAPALSVRRWANASNHGEFASALRQARSAAQLKEEAASLPSDGPAPPPCERREIAAELDAFPSLAPEQLPGGVERGGGPDLAEWLAWFNPQGGLEVPPVVQMHAPSPDVAALVERWVRRVALGGDTRRGVAKLDVGEGRYAGAELYVVAEAGHVLVELSLPIESAGLAERLERRLNDRGYTASVTVR